MKYLITMEAIDHPTNPETLYHQLDEQVFPSVDILTKWEAEGQIYGGVVAGQRRITFVLNVESNADIDKRLKQLPIWGMVRTDVTPLYDFKAHLEHDKPMFEQLKKTLGK